MNSKMIRWLALGLAGGLFGCSTGRDNPTGVRLTGRASKANQSWQFEIVMEGFQLYYRKEWSGEQDRSRPRSQGFFSVDLVIDDFDSKTGDTWGDFGSKGGGGTGTSGKGTAEVARRLWQGNRFRGVAADELRELVEYGHDTEEFLAPVSRKNFRVPCAIKWTDNTSSMPNKTTVYTVEKVRFTYRRDPEFFAEARKKYFPDANRGPVPAPSWHEQPSPAQAIATNALSEAKENPDAAIAKLRDAKAQYPLDRPLGAWNQSVLEGALWQIRGPGEKDGVLDLFYRTLPLAPRDGNTDHGDLDHGPLCLLRAVDAAKRPETGTLLTAIIADPRFDQTDAATIVQMMTMASEGFPVPKEIPLNDERLPKWPLELARALGPKSELLPMWRNVLRRHYGLEETKSALPGTTSLLYKP